MLAIARSYLAAHGCTPDISRIVHVSWEAGDEYLDSLEALSSTVVRPVMRTFPIAAIVLDALSFPGMHTADLDACDDLSNLVALGYPATAALLAELA